MDNVLTDEEMYNGYYTLQEIRKMYKDIENVKPREGHMSDHELKKYALDAVSIVIKKIERYNLDIYPAHAVVSGWADYTIMRGCVIRPKQYKRDDYGEYGITTAPDLRGATCCESCEHCEPDYECMVCLKHTTTDTRYTPHRITPLSPRYTDVCDDYIKKEVTN